MSTKTVSRVVIIDGRRLLTILSYAKYDGKGSGRVGKLYTFGEKSFGILIFARNSALEFR